MTKPTAMRPENILPDMIRNLPEADIPLTGIRGWISQGVDHQVVFFDIEPIGKVPEHSHGEQWGFVLEGEMVLSIEGIPRTCKRGDSYYIPAGAVHSAEFRTRTRLVDFFSDTNRYFQKKK